MSQTLAELANRYKQFAPDPDLHGSFYPADVYPGEAASATIRAHANAIVEHVRIWRMSPLGLEVLAPSGASQLAVGQTVEIDLRLGASSTSLSGLTIVSTTNQLNNKILGIRLIEQPARGFDGEDRRSNRRWLCSDQFVPVCVAPNPARFQDFVYLRVREISPTGMRLITSLRNKFLVKGMTLDCVASFPFISQLPLKVTIENVRLTTENGKDFLSVGVSLKKLNHQERQIIGQYLIQFGEGVALQDLRRQDMAPRSMAPSLDFSFVRSVEDYREVLDLRFRAYRAAQKIPDCFTADDMADIFDTRSRVVIGKYRGKVIATAALVFNEYYDRMEIEDGVEWPNHLPRRDEMVEVVRACTDPSFRGSDVLIAMFQFMAVAVMQSRRPYVVCGCTHDMVGLYAGIGMDRLDLDYCHSKLGGAPHTVMLGDIRRAMNGTSVNPIFWNAVWAPATNYMIDTEILELTTVDRLRMSIYRLCAPIAFMLQRRMRRPRKQIEST